MNVIGQMLVVLLGWGQVVFVSKLELDGDVVKVMCEVDGGLQIISVKLFVVVIVDLCLNELCYVSLFNIMKVKKKLLEEKIVVDYGVDVLFWLEIVLMCEFVGCSVGIKVGFVDELVGKLKEVGVI